MCDGKGFSHGLGQVEFNKFLKGIPYLNRMIMHTVSFLANYSSGPLSFQSYVSPRRPVRTIICLSLSPTFSVCELREISLPTEGGEGGASESTQMRLLSHPSTLKKYISLGQTCSHLHVVWSGELENTDIYNLIANSVAEYPVVKSRCSSLESLTESLTMILSSMCLVYTFTVGMMFHIDHTTRNDQALTPFRSSYKLE